MEHLPSDLGGPFDKLLAIDTVGFWEEAAARLDDLALRMGRGGRAALVSQPRYRGATAETTVAAGRDLAGHLRAAGFIDIHPETLDLRPPAVCVLATRA